MSDETSASAKLKIKRTQADRRQRPSWPLSSILPVFRILRTSEAWYSRGPVSQPEDRGNPELACRWANPAALSLALVHSGHKHFP